MINNIKNDYPKEKQNIFPTSHLSRLKISPERKMEILKLYI